MRTLIAILLFMITGCGLFTERSPYKLYKTFMNIDVPKGIRNFVGEGEIVMPIFMSRGYFIYEADENYFNLLLSYKNFSEVNDKNLSFIERQLNSYELDSLHLLFWTQNTKLEKNISLKNKRTYSGTNYPWQHYILRDTVTNKTYHLVCGLRN